MFRIGCAIVLAFALLIAAGIFIVKTAQQAIPPAPSYLPQVDRR